MKFIDSEVKTNWKYIAIVAVFTILVSGGIIWFTQSSKPTPSQTISIPKTPSPQEQIDTSDWQTYRNEEFGFEVKYPSYWQLEEGYSGGKYSGEDGFFEFLATEDAAGGIDEVSKYEAYFDGRYGSSPISKV